MTVNINGKQLAEMTAELQWRMGEVAQAAKRWREDHGPITDGRSTDVQLSDSVARLLAYEVHFRDEFDRMMNR